MNLLEVVVAMVLFASMGTAVIGSWATAIQAAKWAIEDEQVGLVLDSEAEKWIAGQPRDGYGLTQDFQYVVTESASGGIREIQVSALTVTRSVDLLEAP